jgi:hypothetical protein
VRLSEEDGEAFEIGSLVTELIIMNAGVAGSILGF